MVTSESHVLLTKACEIFIEEVTLRAWRQTQSCSRNTIQSCDIKNALKNSVIYDELNDLVSFEQHSVIHQVRFLDNTNLCSCLRYIIIHVKMMIYLLKLFCFV